MILYKPVLIETAEQAEALPEGTVATHGGTDGYAYEVAIRDDEGLWWSAPGGLGQEEPAYASKTIVGFIALVPIEAEEQNALRWRSGGIVKCGTRDFAIEQAQHGDCDPMQRYTTPWTAA